MDKLPEKEQKRLKQESVMREIQNLRVFVVGGGFQYIQMFDEAGFKGGRGVEDCDIVCFTGGEDVSPDLYGEDRLPVTGNNARRDAEEAYYYGEALALKKPMIGICRGAQFLNVMNGGKLWQDVNNHAIHNGHEIIVVKTGEHLEGMTSTHHQMMRPHEDGEIVAVAGLSTMKLAATEKVERDKPVWDDIEVVWYNDTSSLCFQPHPEFKHGQCRSFFLDLVDEYILPAT